MILLGVRCGCDLQDEEGGDGGVRRGEPNKFDSLCDGVLASMAVLHGSLTEVGTWEIAICNKIAINTRRLFMPLLK